MKRFKLSPLLTLAMATQMILSPVAYAVNPLDLVNMAGQIINQNQQNVAAQQQAIANQQLIAEMTRPGRDKYFNTDSLARIPGLMEYMAQNGINPQSLTCPTLPTTLTEIKAEVCRIGVTSDRGAAPQSQLAEMFSLYKTYGDVAKQYEAYRSNSNAEGQGFGVGCMKNALQTLSGFFAYRLNELDKLTTNLEALNNQFREASKTDLNAIEESTAVLDGGDGELVNEVRTRRPDLFDFGSRFNNPACKSMYAGDALNNMGNSGGLNSISKKTREILSTKPAGSKYSGESYVGAHATVVADINKMADKAAQQFQLNFTAITNGDGYSQFLQGLPSSISSTTGLNNDRVMNNSFFADAQLSYNKEMTQIQADKSTLKSELQAAGVNPDTALNLSSNLNATNFESEVNQLQNQIRNGCLQRSFSGGSAFWDQIRKNIKDPNGSKFANKNEFNSIRNRIEGIMTNSGTTPEGKISQLKSLEQAEGSRFILNMQGSYQKTVMQDGKAVTVNVTPTSSAPSSYFSDIVTTCDAQFSTNKLGSTMTGATAIQKLRDINQEYKTLASDQANTLKQEMRKKLIECGSDSDANNSVAGSCTPERFNTSSPSFCANGAFSCSTNMNNCSTQAQNFVKQIKTERTARVNNYKALVQKNKADIVRIFDTALAKYMKEGEAMRGLFGAGFSSPSGIKRDVTGDKYLSKFKDATGNSPDGALLLEDPDKYVEMFKGNIALLKTEVQKQQQEILGAGGRGGLLAQHVDQTDKNYQTAMTAAQRISNDCIGKHDQYVAQAEAQRQQMMADQQKKQNEMGEKIPEFCRRYGMLQNHQIGACGGDVENLSNVVGKLSPAGAFRAAEYQSACASFNNESNKPSSGQLISTSTMCDELKKINGNNGGTDTEDCEGYRSCMKNLRSATTLPSEGTQRVVPVSCDSFKEEVVTAYNAAVREKKIQVSAANSPTVSESSPEFCTAGFNGDRSVPESSPMNSFMQGLGVQTAQGSAQ